MYVVDRFRLCLGHRSTLNGCLVLHESSDDKTGQHEPHNLRGHVPGDVVSREVIPDPIFNVGAYGGKNTGDGQDNHSRAVLWSARAPPEPPKRQSSTLN